MPLDTATGTSTLFRPGDNCAVVTHASRAAFVVDGEQYFEAFVRAAQMAERSLLVIAWDFDSRMALRLDERGEPLLRLGDFLNRLARSKPRLRIRVLDWDYPMIFGT